MERDDEVRDHKGTERGSEVEGEDTDLEACVAADDVANLTWYSREERRRQR